MSGVLEVVVWWLVLAGVWLVLISTVDSLEVMVGAAVALPTALVARAARRVVTER